MIKKTFLAILVSISLVTTAFAGIIGTEAPNFTLNDMAGKPVSLASYKGSVVFLDFWASWCAPCKEELPNINKFAEELQGSKFVVLAVSVDKKKSHAEDFLKKIPSPAPNFIVLHDAASEAVSKYNAMAMPTSYIIDKKGILRHAHFGYQPGDPGKWKTEVDALLKEQ
ncbi:MAG: TlpA family protein disulfide reductase [Deltaproteobacteria bacterium]|nr:TlpA family protein disulfide reductase [Deltaproteobacteria bacterium]